MRRWFGSSILFVSIFLGVTFSQAVSASGSACAPTGVCRTASQGCTAPEAPDNSRTCPTNQICCVAPVSGGQSECALGQGVCRPGGCQGAEVIAPLSCVPTGGVCCRAQSAGGPALSATINVSNPLSYNDVNELLGSVLTFLQGFIVTLALIFIIIGAFFYMTSGGNSDRIETGKRAITASLIGLALGIGAPAFIREIYRIVLPSENPNLPPGVGTNLTLLQIATNILNFLLSIVGVVALIMMVVGGFMYLTAAGDEDRIDTGKKIVKYSIIGITVALASMVLVRQIAAFF